MSNTTKVWLHSIATAAIGGAVSALSAVIVAPTIFNFTTTGALHILELAITGAIIPVLALLKQSPLPGDTDATPYGLHGEPYNPSKPPVDGANTLGLNK